MTKQMTPEEIEELGRITKAQNRKDSLRNYSIGILLTVMLFLSYKFIKGDFKFLFRETATTTATIVETKMHHIGRGFYRQTVNYSFPVGDTVYFGTFEAGRIKGKQQVGWEITVRYALNNPEINEAL